MDDSLIRRSDAIDALCNAMCELDVEHYPKCDQAQYCDEVSALLSLPSADRPTGRWLRPNETESGYYECSECGALAEIDSVTGEYHLSNFCGECGAKMEDKEVDFLGGVKW